MAAGVDHRPQAPPGAHLDVLLLGACELRADGVAVPAGGALQRGALAMLALAAGQVVPAAELTTGLWGTAPPPSAAGTLRAYLSRLRTGPTAGAVLRDAGGYRLDPTVAGCDAVRFAGAAETAGDDPERLAEALGLWRGDALADLRHLPFADAHASRLEGLRLALRDRRLELLVAQGRHVDALPELDAAVAAAPHDERLVGLLVRALAGAGRHSEALASLDRARRRLREDLGLEPGPELRDLQAAVLVHDPVALRPTAPVAPSTAAPAAPPEETVGNVPLPLTSFVGRGAELSALAELVDHARLATLTGPGGCGKTRLALEAVRRLRAATRREAWVVEFAEVDDAGLVPTVVARALGVATVGGGTTGDALVAALQGRRVLLLLDNCEHVVDQAAVLVEQLLARCAGVQVLATSREPLGVPGERVLAVGALPVGDGDVPGDAERLLLERAAGHGVDGADPGTAALVRRICRSLDGIPLALELAAARCNVLSLAELADRLDDRFAILDHGSRTALPRHRTLAAAIGWSHDLLSAEQQALFASASVFRGAFELEDLAAVHGGGSAALVGVLGALVDKSMVASDNRVTGTRRYRLLETLRVFGRQQLDDDERARLADAHMHRMTQRAEDAASRLRGFDDAPAWRWLDATQGDLRVAFDHAVRTGSPCAPRLLVALAWYAYRRGVVREGLRWCDRARPLRDAAGPDVAAAAVLAEALLAYLAGDAQRLARMTGEMRAGADTTADPTLRTLANVYLSYFEAAFGDAGRAAAHLQDAVALVGTGAPAPWVAAEVAMPRGQFLRARGQAAEAVRVLREGQAVGVACGHRWAVGSLAWIEAKARLDLRDPAGAASLLQTTVHAFVAQGDRTSTLAALHTMAAVAAALERHDDGARLLGAVDALGERIGYDVRAMDPVDAERHRASVRFACRDEDWGRWLDEGRALSMRQALQLADRIAGAAT